MPEPNSDFVAVSGSDEYSMGLKSDGTVVAWGLNDYYQCEVAEPNEEFAAVAAGRYHGMALRTSAAVGAEELRPERAPTAPTLRIRSVAPNPFNPFIDVFFETREACAVSMEVYDVSGRRVTTLPLGRLEPGPHRAAWDGRNPSGASLPSGVYFIRLRGAEGVSAAVTAVLLR